MFFIAACALALAACARPEKEAAMAPGAGGGSDEPPSPPVSRTSVSELEPLDPKVAEQPAAAEPMEVLAPPAMPMGGEGSTAGPRPDPMPEAAKRAPSDNAPMGSAGLAFKGDDDADGYLDTGATRAAAAEKPTLARDVDDALADLRDSKALAPDDGSEDTEEEDERAGDGKREKGKVKDLSRFSRRDGDLSLVPPTSDALRFVRPPRVLPRIFYFENTYLGGSAAYAERLRRLDVALREDDRHYRRARAEAQPFDPPARDGLAVTASVDATHIEDPQRVFLQVGLRGSDRYGWRRPPLDVALVIDPSVPAQAPGVATRFVIDLLRKLGSADRLAIVIADATPTTHLELARTPSAQQHLARRIDELEARRPDASGNLAAAMRRAGAILDAASDAEAVVPGSQTILVLTGPPAASQIPDATRAAHELSVQGAVTSVFTLDRDGGSLWQVANSGHGNFHRIDGQAFGLAIDEELASLARVVARLVRVNVRLGKDAHAIRVLGTRVLDAAEVAAVKERELATDRNLSKTLGIVSDRGEDDDGIQTVIPYFYGDDSHVILIELWVERPGLVADITVRYKDMVNLDNATARTSVRLGARPGTPSREQTVIAQNVRGFLLGESLQKASNEVGRGDAGNALRTLEAARAMATTTNPLDVQAVEGLKQMVQRGSWQYDASERANVQEQLLISGQRRVGDTDKDE